MRSARHSTHPRLIKMRGHSDHSEAASHPSFKGLPLGSCRLGAGRGLQGGANCLDPPVGTSCLVLSDTSFVQSLWVGSPGHLLGGSPCFRSAWFWSNLLDRLRHSLGCFPLVGLRGLSGVAQQLGDGLPIRPNLIGRIVVGGMGDSTQLNRRMPNGRYPTFLFWHH